MLLPKNIENEFIKWDKLEAYTFFFLFKFKLNLFNITSQCHP